MKPEMPYDPIPVVRELEPQESGWCKSQPKGRRQMSQLKKSGREETPPSSAFLFSSGSTNWMRPTHMGRAACFTSLPTQMLRTPRPSQIKVTTGGFSEEVTLEQEPSGGCREGVGRGQQ